MILMNKKLYLMISNDCNKNCDHCYMRNKKNKNLKYIKDINDEVINKIIHYVNHFNIDDVILYGYGEPLYSVDINKLVLLVTNINKLTKAKVKLQTNLNYELTPVHLLLYKNVDIVKVPFDIGGIRFKSYKELIQWFYNLRTISKVANDILLEITITKKVYEKAPDKWKHFLNNLISKGYIKSYCFHSLQLAGNALDNQDKLLNFSFDKEYAQLISDWNRSIIMKDMKYKSTINREIFSSEYLLKPILLLDDIDTGPYKSYIYKFDSSDIISIVNTND